MNPRRFGLNRWPSREEIGGFFIILALLLICASVFVMCVGVANVLLETGKVK